MPRSGRRLLARCGLCKYRTGRYAPPPCRQDRVDQVGVDARGGVDVEVVRAEVVDAVDLDMGASLSDASITAEAFATVQFVECAVHSDQEHIEAVEKCG
jgi:hypothetical protein